MDGLKGRCYTTELRPYFAYILDWKDLRDTSLRRKNRGVPVGVTSRISCAAVSGHGQARARVPTSGFCRPGAGHDAPTQAKGFGQSGRSPCDVE